MWRRVSLLLLFGIILSFNSFAQNNYEGHLSQAKLLITQQKYGEAIAEARKAIALDGNRWEAFVIAAKGYSSQKLYDDAIGMLQLALVHAPEDKKPLVRDAIAECRKEQNQGIAPNTPRPIPPAGPALTSGSTETTPTQAEIVLWKSIENSTNSGDFKAYLEQYPQGTFVALAKIRLAQFTERAEQRQKELEHNSLGSILVGTIWFGKAWDVDENGNAKNGSERPLIFAFNDNAQLVYVCSFVDNEGMSPGLDTELRSDARSLSRDQFLNKYSQIGVWSGKTIAKSTWKMENGSLEVDILGTQGGWWAKYVGARNADVIKGSLTWKEINQGSQWQVKLIAGPSN